MQFPKTKSTYLYLHRKASNDDVFYVGIGGRYRPRSMEPRNKHWEAVARKHGVIVQIVGEFDTREDACNMEQYFIAVWRDAGFQLANKTSGGTSDYHFTDDVRARMSSSLSAACKRPETIKKKRQTMATEEYRANMAAALREARARPDVKAKMAKYRDSEEYEAVRNAARLRMARAVIRSDGVRFFSINAAAAHMGVTDAAIRSVLLRHSSTCCGFGWRFDGEPPPPPKEKAKRTDVVRSDGEEFSSLAAAARSVGVTPGAVRYAIDSGSTTAGFTWSQRNPRLQCGSNGSRAVIRGDGVAFESCSAAAAAAGVSQSMISRVLNGKAKTAGGFTWSFASQAMTPS